MMRIRRFGSLLRAVLALQLFALVPTGQAAASDALLRRYDAAVAYAKRERVESEVFRNLTAITPDNRKLRWRTVDSRRQVLCVTWTDKVYYPGAVMTLPRDKVVWVTVVPELRSFFRKHGSNGMNPTLRAEQLLGLPPDFKLNRFVEFWAFPEDLIRPSPDPEITDHEAEIRFRPASRFTSSNASYRKWFGRAAAMSYEGKRQFPWTRLGYTYDWSADGHHIGLSEFVVLGGAKIQVASVFSNEDYLRGR